MLGALLSQAERLVGAGLQSSRGPRIGHLSLSGKFTIYSEVSHGRSTAALPKFMTLPCIIIVILVLVFGGDDATELAPENGQPRPRLSQLLIMTIRQTDRAGSVSCSCDWEGPICCIKGDGARALLLHKQR